MISSATRGPNPELKGAGSCTRGRTARKRRAKEKGATTYACRLEQLSSTDRSRRCDIGTWKLHTKGPPLHRSPYSVHTRYRGESDGTLEWGRTGEVLEKALNMGHQTSLAPGSSRFLNFLLRILMCNFYGVFITPGGILSTIQEFYSTELRVLVLIRSDPSEVPYRFSRDLPEASHVNHHLTPVPSTGGK